MRPVTLAGSVVIISMILAGCSDESSAIEAAEKTIHSWSSTLQLADHELSESHVTKIYAQQTVRQAIKAIGKQQKELGKLKSASAKRDLLRTHLAAVREQAD